MKNFSSVSSSGTLSSNHGHLNDKSVRQTSLRSRDADNIRPKIMRALHVPNKALSRYVVSRIHFFFVLIASDTDTESVTNAHVSQGTLSDERSQRRGSEASDTACFIVVATTKVEKNK